MSVQGAVRDSFKGMIKSSGHVKHFRHQCTALIQICRDFWALVVRLEDEDYQSFQQFMTIADYALQAAAGFTQSPDNKPWDKEPLQEVLDKAVLDLEGYCKTLSGFEDYDPIALMLKARSKDQERSLRIAAISKLKSQVSFYIHEGSGPWKMLSLNISKESTSEELLFKLGRKPEAQIRLHESAHFYTGPDITWNKEVMHIKLGSDPSTYRPKPGFSDFKTYFGAPQQGPVHVFVDRNPSIHILLTATKWSRLFSLARLIDNDKIMVLKGVDGTLYHAQQVVGQLNIPTSGAGVFQLDRATNNKDRINAELPTSAIDCIEILRNAHTFILAENRRWTTKEWLIEVAPTSHEPPKSLTEGPKIRHIGRRVIHHTLPESLPSTVNRAGTTANATIHVKGMVEKLEKERKEAEKRIKEEQKGKGKGLFGRVFGR
ncbi:hypothetical protein RSOL_553420 [Rhizoctonia solani AG-3 Rhs1AP]|uniref:Uncharacterized protein n=2 Tax=Rhizoctonia solani AG-3 TaxID=1086053 RepID=A0A074SVJ5_9AGAM|nr:hypothetical protein RSOL_553420 [Rhizoctonia solani AG-3 Rhs1AP]KEP53922.1 hypothetical protein V565_024440 [Rhizoctonia solani 123E]